MRSRWERGHERSEHAITSREFDERLTALRESLVIAAEPTPAHHPGERALNHPALGLRLEAGGKQRLPVHFLAFGHEQAPFGDRERMDRLDGPTQRFFDPDQKRSTIMTVTPDKLQTGKQLFEGREQGTTSLVIGFLGSRHLHSQQVALRVDQCVTLATPHFFSPNRSPFRDHARRWF